MNRPPLELWLKGSLGMPDDAPTILITYALELEADKARLEAAGVMLKRAAEIASARLEALELDILESSEQADGDDR